MQLSWAAQPDGDRRRSRGQHPLAGVQRRRHAASTNVLGPHVHAAVRRPTNVFFTARGERPRRAARRGDIALLDASRVIDPVTGAAPVPKARLQLSGTVATDSAASCGCSRRRLRQRRRIPVPRGERRVRRARPATATSRPSAFPGETRADRRARADHDRRGGADAGLVAGRARSSASCASPAAAASCGVYDLTPGIQTIVNPRRRPRRATRRRRRRARSRTLWGGLSLAADPRGAGGRSATLRCVARPRLATPARRRTVGHRALKIGIFVVRRTGGTKHGAGRRAAEDQGRRPRPARRGEAGPQPLPLGLQGRREAAEARQVPADLPPAARATRSRRTSDSIPFTVKR